MILHNAIIYIQSILNKDKNPYKYGIFLEKCFFSGIIMVRFGEIEIAKAKFYAAKKTKNLGF